MPLTFIDRIRRILFLFLSLTCLLSTPTAWANQESAPALPDITVTSSRHSGESATSSYHRTVMGVSSWQALAC